MAKITNIDELIPEDIELVYRGETYIISGDVSVPDVLKLFQATQMLMGEIEPEDAAKKIAVVEREVMRIINLSRPEGEKLTKCPFGSRSLGLVLVEILRHLMPDMFEPTGNPPTPAITPARPSTSRKRSSRSSASAPKPKRSRPSTGSRG